MMTASNSWMVSWWEGFGLSSDVPQWVFALLALLFTYCFVVVPAGAALSFLDRKFSADLQARVGPNQAGPAGLFQPIADLLKLLQKGSLTKRPQKASENIWLSVHSMALYSTLAVMPLGSAALLVDTEMSAFLPFWSALVLALGTMLLGLGQNSVPGWFGGIRIAAQTLAGSFPALIALICVGVHAGSFRWSALAGAQGFSPWSWALFSNPFLTIAFLVFIMSGMIVMASAPFDGGLALTDIHGGVASHLYGRRLGYYRFGRFYVFFLWSVITVVLFLGGWALPGRLVSLLREGEAVRVLSFLELSWLMAKTFLLMLFMIWVARVNPRSRVDQITDFAWKVLSPFSLFALVGTSLWVGWGIGWGAPW
ncbi:MAG: NADH-quinone oxidoreductase subunit H [Bdellovibrio sp.]|nr:NADH-quinone oxidoreductase subunit H [Bdellovibrio sp.]